jgi:hypothetical protein
VTVYKIVYGLELKAASSQLKKALSWLHQNEQTGYLLDSGYPHR